MKITDILEHPVVWQPFRKIIDILFGIYRKRQAIIRQFGITNQLSVVDVACGTGQYSTITDFQYLGIDLSEKYIETAKKLYGKDNKTFLCADANTSKISDGSYDVALLIDATHHLSDEENRILIKTLNKIASQFIVICDPVTQSKNNLIGRFLAYMDRGEYIRPTKVLSDLISETLDIKKIVLLKMMGTESVCILAKPRDKTR
ncbi:MAG: class I SAM-dependent methyltransferase [bacterium]|nr:class I SAM-dependent methyltransferase [bacterium]